MSNEKKVLMKIEHLTKEFEIKSKKLGGKPQILHALNDVSVDIYEGETLGVIGESGCGKSTFGRTLIQLHKATAGSVTFDGKDLFSLKGAELKKAKKDAEDDGDSDEDDSGYVNSGPGAVKGHASGGFPKSGQMFVANEDGNPELIGSWGGHAAVANNQQIIQGISQAVQNGMRSCMTPIVSHMASIAQNAAPSLTTVGTGRSYSPDGQWLQSMADRVMSLDSASMSDQYLAMMVDLLKQIIDLIENLDLTVNIDIREIKKKLTDLEKRSGYTLRTT